MFLCISAEHLQCTCSRLIGFSRSERHADIVKIGYFRVIIVVVKRTVCSRVWIPATPDYELRKKFSCCSNFFIRIPESAYVSYTVWSAFFHDFQDIVNKLQFIMWNDWQSEVRETAMKALVYSGHGLAVHDGLLKRIANEPNAMKRAEAVCKLGKLGLCLSEFCVRHRRWIFASVYKHANMFFFNRVSNIFTTAKWCV